MCKQKPRTNKLKWCCGYRGKINMRTSWKKNVSIQKVLLNMCILATPNKCFYIECSINNIAKYNSFVCWLGEKQVVQLHIWNQVIMGGISHILCNFFSLKLQSENLIKIRISHILCNFFSLKLQSENLIKISSMVKFNEILFYQR
jgi:hypothetical protein